MVWGIIYCAIGEGDSRIQEGDCLVMLPDLSNYHFNFYSLPPLLTSAILLSLGIAVLLRDRASQISRIFFLMLATTSFWLFAFSWMYSASDESTATWWAKVAYLDIPFICAAIYHFTVLVLEIYQQHRRLVLVSWLLSTVFASSSLLSDALISGVYNYWWGYYPRYSWLALPFLTYFMVMLAMSGRHYLVKYRACPPGARKMRIKWFLIGCVGPLIASVDFLPKLGVPVYPVGFLAILWWLSFVGFAVWEYHILHITPSFAADQILQTMADAVLVIDQDGVICIVNHATGPLLRIAQSDLVGMSLSSIDRSLADIISVAKWVPDGCIHRTEVVLSRPVDDVITVELSASIIKDSDGSIVSTVCVLRDVTSRKQAELALHNLNATLDRQVQERTMDLRSLVFELSRAEERERARLATDLHDNLAQLLALAKMRLESLASGAVNRQRDAIAGITRLVNEALTYTRTVMSDLRPMFSGTERDLMATISWVAEKMRKHGLIVEIHDDAGPLLLDEPILTVVYQSVQEVLANVLKHAQTERADIYLRRTDDYLEAIIMDHGRGFDVSITHTPSEAGGFGLFNIRERLHLLGGRLDITSNPGAGTTATIVAPLKPAPSLEGKGGLSLWKQMGEPAKDTHCAPHGSRQVRVVLTEDNQMMRQEIRRAIEAKGDAEVIAEAGDGVRAVQLVRAMQPDVVVMDVGLPKMNGVEATRRIKTEFPSIAVIGVSVSGGGTSESAMRAVGACAYFSKAESLKGLPAAVRAATMLD